MQSEIDQHKALVDMLEEQSHFGEPKEHEPIIKTKPENIKIGSGSRIDSFVKLEGGEGLTIGRYVHIASYAHLGIGGGTTYIDDYSAIASGGKVISGSNDVFAKSMSACAAQEIQRVTKYVTRVCRYAVVLCNAVVLPGVTLHEGAVLAAGGVATKDIPKWEVWGGVPARFMFKRGVK